MTAANLGAALSGTGPFTVFAPGLVLTAQVPVANITTTDVLPATA